MEGSEILSSRDDAVAVSPECSSVDSSGRTFTWFQSEDSVDIALRLPHCSGSKCRSKPTVDISSSEVTIRGLAADGREASTLLNVNLYAPIRISESTWSVSGDMLEISLEKQGGGCMWPRLES